jgi:poly(3-hydroxybutyrate) depolymerase
MRFKKFALASCLLAIASFATPTVYAAAHTASTAASSMTTGDDDPATPVTGGTATVTNIMPVSTTEGIVQFTLNTGRVVTSHTPVNTSRIHLGDKYHVDDVTSDIIIIIIDLGDVIIIIICS